MMKPRNINYKPIITADDDEERETPFAAPVTFHQDLINQLNTFILSDDDDRDIAEFLVGSIDDMGYIRRTVARYC
jgi:RNA polymerase sigma-54 factor